MNRFYCFIVILLSPLVRLVYPYRLHIEGELPEGGAVICANHSSYIDPVLIAVISISRSWGGSCASWVLFPWIGAAAI